MSEPTPPFNSSTAKNSATGKNRFAGKVFKGKLPELGVFQTPEERSNTNVKQFEQTKEDIVGEIQANVGKGGVKKCLLQSVENEVMTPPIRPTRPVKDASGNVDEQEKEDYEEERRLYYKAKDNFEGEKTAVWGLITGQCSDVMMDKLKARPQYAGAKNGYDFVTLLKLIRLISISGKLHVNAAVHYQASFSKFINCRQGKQSNTDYLREFKARYAVLKELDPQTDTVFGEERRAALFIANADGHRYGDLRRELANSMALNNDLYPVTLTAAYGLLEQYIGSSAAVRPNNSQQSQPYPLVSLSQQVKSSVVLTQGHMVNPNWILLDSCATVCLFKNPLYLQDIKEAPTGCEVHSTAGSMTVTMAGLLPFLGTSVWFNEKAIANVLSYSMVMDRFPTTAVTKPGCKYTHCVIVHLPNGLDVKFCRSENGLLYHDPTAHAHSSSVFTPPCFVMATVKENLMHYTRRQQKGIAKAKNLYETLGFPAERTFMEAIAQNQILNCPVRLDDARNMLQVYGRHVQTMRGRSTRRRRNHVPSNASIPLPASILEAQQNITLCADLFFVDGLTFLLTVSRNIRFITVHALNRRSMTRDVLPKLDTVFNTYRARGFRITALHADNEFRPLVPILLQPSHGHVPVHICGANSHVPEAERAIRTVKERNRATVSHLSLQGIKRYPRVLKRSLVVDCARQLNLFPLADGVSPIFGPLTLITGVQPDANLHCRVPFGTYCEVNDEPTPSNTETPRTTPCLALGPHDLLHGTYWFLSTNTGERLHRDHWTELPMTTDIVERVHALADLEQPLRDEIDPFLYEFDKGSPISDPTPTFFAVSQEPNVNPAVAPTAGAVELQEDETEGQEVQGNNHEDYHGGEVNENAGAGIDESGVGEHPVLEDPQGNEIDEEMESNQDSDAEGSQEEEIDRDTIFPAVEDLSNNGSFTKEADDDESYLETTSTDGLAPMTGTQTTKSDGNSVGADLEDLSGRSTRSRPNIFQPPSILNERTERELKQLSDHNHAPLVDDESPSVINEQEQVLSTLQSTNPCRLSVQARTWYTHHTLTLFLRQQQTMSLQSDDLQTAAGILLTQMSAKKGIKEFGERAVEALLKEFGQLDRKDVLDPIAFGALSREQRMKALRAISLIKEKRDGRIKGRTVADGRPQRKYKSPEDIYSPTVSTEGMFLSLAIDAKEKRHVAICDVEGAYLHSDMDEFVLMVVEGDMVEILVRANPARYKSFVHVTKKGKPILYVRLKKALYGCIQSAMLWWKLLTSVLVEIGFRVNPYDNCVANKTMDDGKQCTICWYVDDLKVSHVSERVVRDVIQTIEGRFGPMTQAHGTELNYLGMDIKFTPEGTVEILMSEYLQEAFELFPEDISRVVNSPAADHLFNIDPNCEKLTEDRRKLLHSITAKLLYVGKRARPDILVPISFLTSCVTMADVED